MNTFLEIQAKSDHQLYEITLIIEERIKALDQYTAYWLRKREYKKARNLSIAADSLREINRRIQTTIHYLRKSDPIDPVVNYSETIKSIKVIPNALALSRQDPQGR